MSVEGHEPNHRDPAFQAFLDYICGMEVPEFRLPRPPVRNATLFKIMPETTWNLIERAAIAAFEDDIEAANSYRFRAGY